MKLKIEIPDNNTEERKYILEVIFSEILGLEFSVSYTNTDYYKIYFLENKILKIKDCFFNLYPESKSYLNINALPKKIQYVTNQLTVNDELPIIFGDPETHISENEIKTNVDLFSSAFFMLTRWEEHVSSKTDEHDRYDEQQSIAIKNDFIYRPIVNEYIEYLWNALCLLGYNRETRLKRDFQIVLTHDVDHIRKWKNLKIYLEDIYDDITNPLAIFIHTKSYISSLFNKNNDPYNTWDFLMRESERVGTKSYFNFMTGGNSKYDNKYDINSKTSQNIIQKILSRNHHFGFHPSYNSYNDLDQIKKEKEKLESILIDSTIKCGRQHYLRFEVPHTWQLWDDLGIPWESTITYGKTSGFRCGICYPFTVFNVVTREKLNLVEKPLIFMEQTFIGYKESSPDEVISFAKNLLEEVKKYNGEFVLLWHNSSFNTYTMSKYKGVYSAILNEYIKLKNS
tara:strand:+ start:111 stop:1472 length:1362 start_codon:yes stop_codon:yes gene_type:complete